MKLKHLIWFVTVFVVFYTLLTQLHAPFPLVFLIFLSAQGLFIYMIWRILRNPYSTNRTFNDWYGDKDVRD